MKRSPKVPALAWRRCRPAHFQKDAQDHTCIAILKAHDRRTRSYRADGLLLLLVGLLVFAGFTRCTSARRVPTEAHATSAEHATPHGRYEWRNADCADD